jgi:LPS export ABC transporter protein LptC
MGLDSQSLEKQTINPTGCKGRFGGNRLIKRLTNAIFITLIAACNQVPKQVGQPAAGKVPDSILENAAITMTSAGLKRAVILADTLDIFEKEDSNSAVQVRVDFYNDSGQFQSTLTANRGLVRQKREAFTAWGNVVVANDTSRLETQSLDWDAKRGLITTNDFVRFQRRDDVITGFGMEADSKLENVRVLRDVKGRISDIPQSEEEIDSLDSPRNESQVPE